jgi:hypothetical protein
MTSLAGNQCCPDGCITEDYISPEKRLNNNKINATFSDVYKINAAFSDEMIVERKREITLNAIQTIKYIAYLDYDWKGGVKTGSLNGKNITDPKRAEEQENTCEKLLLKYRNIKLTLEEKRNLYLQLLNSIIRNNPFHLHVSLRTIISDNSVGLEVPDDILDAAINKQLKIIINVILLNAIIFSDEVDNYNYSELFNFGYYFIILNLQVMRSYVLARCFSEIQQIYGPSYFPKFHIKNV